MLTCLAYLAITLILPLKNTYNFLLTGQSSIQGKLWSRYWTIFALIMLVKSFFTFLNYTPFLVVLAILHYWLYSADFKGALLLNDIIVEKIRAFGLNEVVDMIGENLKPFGVFQEKDQNKRQ